MLMKLTSSLCFFLFPSLYFPFSLSLSSILPSLPLSFSFPLSLSLFSFSLSIALSLSLFVPKFVPRSILYFSLFSLSLSLSLPLVRAISLTHTYKQLTISFTPHARFMHCPLNVFFGWKGPIPFRTFLHLFSEFDFLPTSSEWHDLVKRALNPIDRSGFKICSFATIVNEFLKLSAILPRTNDNRFLHTN